MNNSDLVSQRVINQQLLSTNFKSGSELVQWFGAMQAQDFAGAKWAIGQRLGLKDEEIEQEFNDGKILRTHIMRPTWHFVHPSDLLWMQKLTKSRVEQQMAYYTRNLNLNRDYFDKCNKIFKKALTGKFLTRTELAKALEESGISIKNQKLGHVVIQAELDCLITSGPRVGKQFTYTLVSERISKSQLLTPNSSLAELATRYFQSHGPATIKDFVWWSGLTTVDAKKGIEEANLKSETIENITYYSLPIPYTKYHIPNTVSLLPNYDEYTIAYKDRSEILADINHDYFKDQGNAAFWNAIIYKGKVVGAWKKIPSKNLITIKRKLFIKLSEEFENEYKKALRIFEDFNNVIIASV